MSCICIANQHDQASLTVPAVQKSKQAMFRVKPQKLLSFPSKQHDDREKKYLRKVTLVGYHEVHQAGKVVSQKLRSSPDKCTF